MTCRGALVSSGSSTMMHSDVPSLITMSGLGVDPVCVDALVLEGIFELYVAI